MPEIRYYVAGGRQPFAQWYADLAAAARAKVTRAIVRLEQGNFSNVKSVGEGVFEYRIDFGPGYRLYFGQDGQTLVILLTGGTKKRQQRDIDAARLLAGLQTNQARAALSGDERWQRPKAFETWSSTTSRPTRNSPRRCCAKASMPC
jgi:putative addiction module killer protein